MINKEKNFISSHLLFPYKFKPAGYLLILPGILLLYVRFYLEQKPSFFDIKAFAVYSTYLVTKYFSLIENHFTEELGGILIILGFLFVVLSKEREEKAEFDSLRLRSFILAFYVTSLFSIISILFVFGLAFIKIFMFILVLNPLVYLIVFKYSIWKLSKKLK